jgi:hypothetical protein
MRCELVVSSKISCIGWLFDVLLSAAQLFPLPWLLFLLKLQMNSVLLSLLLSPVVVISSPFKIIVFDIIAIVAIIPRLVGSPHVKAVFVHFASHRCPCQFLVDYIVLGKDSYYYRRAQEPTRNEHQDEYEVAVGYSCLLSLLSSWAALSLVKGHAHSIYLEY